MLPKQEEASMAGAVSRKRAARGSSRREREARSCRAM